MIILGVQGQTKRHQKQLEEKTNEESPDEIAVTFLTNKDERNKLWIRSLGKYTTDPANFRTTRINT